jgi:hypothetical protein
VCSAPRHCRSLYVLRPPTHTAGGTDGGSPREQLLILQLCLTQQDLLDRFKSELPSLLTIDPSLNKSPSLPLAPCLIACRFMRLRVWRALTRVKGPDANGSHPTLGLSHLYLGLSRPTVGLSHLYLGLSRPYLGLSHMYLGLSRPTVGLSHPALGLSRLYLGLSRPTVGLSRPTVGLSHLYRRLVPPVP